MLFVHTLLLLQNGADVHIRNADNKVAMDLAEQSAKVISSESLGQAQLFTPIINGMNNTWILAFKSTLIAILLQPHCNNDTLFWAKFEIRFFV